MKPENNLIKAIRSGCAQRGRRILFLLGTGGVAAAIWISCATVNRVVVAPPQIAGAEFLGSEACADCHDKITQDFPTATHADLMAKGDNAVNVGCESCHGAGSLHVESGGAPRTIINPARSPEVCFQCHLDKRGQFNLPFHHQVLEGKVNCSDCHNPHKGPAMKGGGTQLISETENCLECHTAQRGPFVFEHEAMREGCVVCHDPHGTVNNKMLRDRNANTCLKCHPLQRTSGGVFIGGFPHEVFVPGSTSRLSQGTCWSAGCHEAVHGSQVNSSLRF